MQMFKLFFKIVKKELIGISIGIMICLVMTIGINSQSNSGKSSGEFKMEKCNILIKNSDDSPLSDAICKYLDSKHNIKHCNYNDDQIKEFIYAQKYIAYIEIPKGFGESQNSGEKKQIRTISDEGTPYNTFINMQINEYIDCIADFEKLGYDRDRAVEEADKTCKTSEFVKVIEDENNKESENKGKIYTLFVFVPYCIMYALLFSILPIIIRIKEKDIKNRIDVSGVSNIKSNIGIVGGTAIVSTIVMIATITITSMFLGKEVFTQKWWLAVLNISVYTLTTTMIIYLLSSLKLKAGVSVSVVANIISLSFAFLGGIFVPLEFLGDGVKSVGRFLPTYWYARAIGEIDAGGSFGSILQMMGIEILFGAVCLAMGLAISSVTARKANI